MDRHGLDSRDFAVSLSPPKRKKKKKKIHTYYGEREREREREREIQPCRNADIRTHPHREINQRRDRRSTLLTPNSHHKIQAFSDPTLGKS